MAELEKLIELIKPYMSGLSCADESGTCELTSCRECRARNCANDLLANGVVVPPCKVGDTMYFDGKHFASRRKGEIMERRVDAVLTEAWATFRGEVDVSFDFDDFGKTVFLSREDAEKALKERSEGK